MGILEEHDSADLAVMAGRTEHARAAGYVGGFEDRS
jgi:hypothetical protein